MNYGIRSDTLKSPRVNLWGFATLHHPSISVSLPHSQGLHRQLPEKQCRDLHKNQVYSQHFLLPLLTKIDIVQSLLLSLYCPWLLTADPVGYIYTEQASKLSQAVWNLNPPRSIPKWPSCPYKQYTFTAIQEAQTCNRRSECLLEPLDILTATRR